MEMGEKGWEEGAELAEERHCRSRALPGGKGSSQRLGECGSSGAINRNALGGIAEVSSRGYHIGWDGGGRVVPGTQASS